MRLLFLHRRQPRQHRLTLPDESLYAQRMGTHHDVRNCACYNLRAATRFVTNRYDEILAPSGLLSTQFSMLNFIDRTEPCGMAELGDSMIMDVSTVTRNLRPLESAGLISIRSSSKDGRRKEIRLTAKGRRALDVARPLWIKAQDETAEKLGTKRFDQLLAAISQLVS